jgi:hypothetical protein
MDYHSILNEDIKGKSMEFVLNSMPQYLSSKHRVHKMFYKKCEAEIHPYESCIGNPRW